MTYNFDAFRREKGSLLIYLDIRREKGSLLIYLDIGIRLDPAAMAALRDDHVNLGRPLGTAAWAADAARRLGLASTLRSVGRPRKEAGNE